MNFFEAVVLGVVEGLTEFLPISSTAHLLVAERLLGLPMETQEQRDALIGFTAVIQSGAIAAAVLFFFKDILRLASSFFGGLRHADRRPGQEFQLSLAVLIGCLPIAVVGFVLQDVIRAIDEELITVAIGLIAFSAVFVIAERRGTQTRSESSVRPRDGLVLGLAQCLALVPGVSRSGATISAGLLSGLDRVTATRLSFLLGIPALLGAGALGLSDAAGTDTGVGPGATAVATLVSFVVGYASIAWLLRFVSGHTIVAFVPYRVALGLAVLVAVVVG